MKNEYDFSGGEKGKYAERYKAGTNLVRLDPDVKKHFPNSDSVNKALRTILNTDQNDEKESA